MRCFSIGYRKLSVCAKEPIWALLVTLLVVYAYTIRYWRYLLLTVSGTFFLTLISWCFTDESVRWLVGKIGTFYIHT